MLLARQSVSGAQRLISFSERTLGGLDVFLPYVNDYVNTFMGKSITTQQWKDHLYAYYQKHGGSEKIKLLDSIDWDVRTLIYQGDFRD